MTILTSALVNAWTDKDRLNLTALDSNLESQIASQVIAQASQAFDTSTWVSEATTPTLIKSVMAMMYAGRIYQNRNIDSVDDLTFYGSKLIQDANTLLENIISGLIVLKDASTGVVVPMASPAQISYEPIESDPMFSMEMIF